MKAFLFDSLNRFRKYSEELDTKAEIRKCLCGKAWLVFNNSGDKEVYIFQEDGSLIISINGNITRGSWEYLSVNNSIAISASNQEYMVHPAFLDNILFALQVDGTENYAFLIDQKNALNFAPKSLDDLHRYFRQKEQKRIEEENRIKEEQRLAELKQIEEANRIREELRLAEQKRIEKEKKEREERERRERKQREEQQKNRLAEKIYKDEIIKSRLLCFLFYSNSSAFFWVFVAFPFALLLACWVSYVVSSNLFELIICWLLALFLCFYLCLYLVIFSFYSPLTLILRCRLKKFIKNNRTYSTDMLYRLVAYHNAPTTDIIGYIFFKLSDNGFKKLILDQIPTNEIHYTTNDNRFLSLSLSGVQILSHLYYQDMNLFIMKFDKDVTEIGDRAFSNCSNLTSISIPPSVKKIGDAAFSGCESLTSIVIPTSVTEIGETAFSDCSSLTSITIPPSVTKIGESAFSDCSSLTSISIPSSVTKIGDWAFSYCSNITSIAVSKDNKVYDSREGCNAIIHTKSNTLISGCKNTIIPTSITQIVKSAFSGCYSLTSISIPPSVTKIGEGAFSDCSSLTSIAVSKDNKVYDSREGCNAIIHTKSNTLISGCKNTIIPTSITQIGEEAFYYCSSLTSITIPPSVTEIGEGAFSECSSLTSITIPPSVTEIGNWAFSGCNSLSEVRIPKGCNVHESAFEDSPNVEIIRY